MLKKIAKHCANDASHNVHRTPLVLQAAQKGPEILPMRPQSPEVN